MHKFSLKSFLCKFNSNFLFENYFWCYAVCALLNSFFSASWIFTLGFPLLIYYITFFKTKKNTRINFLDILWVFNVMIIALTWITNDYPHKLYLISRTFLAEIAYMMAYWIGRWGRIDYLKIIIIKAKTPLLITGLIGIYCLFFEPSWYVRIVEKAVEHSTGGYSVDKSMVMDQYRLRSIFDGPYPLSYFCAFMLMLYFFSVFKCTNDFIGKYKLFYLVVPVGVIILCMMRGPLLCVIIGLFVSYIYSVLYVRNHSGTVKVFFIVIGLVILVFMIYSSMESVMKEHFFSKLDALSSNSDDFFRSRLFLQKTSITFLGEGFGKYNAVTYYVFGSSAIPDGEYMKIVAEQGMLGLSITMLLFVGGIIKALCNFRHLYFELCILAMLIICMIGADPLSISDKHCFIYWLALGQISQFKSKNYQYEEKNTITSRGTSSAN